MTGPASAEITWKGNKLRPIDEDDLLILLFGMSRFRVRDIDWSYQLTSDKFGLLRMAGLQDRTLDFDPVSVRSHTVIVDMCRDRNESQRGAIIEWARMNPGLIPHFIMKLKSNERFAGWFKSYYDSLPFLYKRLIRDEAPCILSLENELEGTYRRQATIEREKFAEIKLEYEERAKRVAWFDDGDAHKGMRERGCLLHSLPQLTVRKTNKRGRSRSRSRVRSTVRRGSRVASHSSVGNLNITGRYCSVSPRRRVIEREEAKRDQISHALSPRQEGEMEAVAGPSVVVAEPRTVSDLTQDEDVNLQLSKDASDDEDLQFVVPPELVSSLLD